MKKYISVFLAIITAISLGGCSLDDSNYETSNTENSDTVSSSTFLNDDNGVTEEADSSTNISEIGTVYVDGCTTFADGFAWVEYRYNNAGGDRFTSVIDADGNVVFSVYEDIEFFSPFLNGYSFYKTYSDVYRVVDSKGNVIATSENGEFDKVIAAGEGMFVVEKYISDISTSRYCWGVIDENGEFILDYVPAYQTFLYEENRYIGENYFCITAGGQNDNYVINIKTGEISKTFERDGVWDKDYYVISGFESGTAVLGKSGAIYTMDKNLNKALVYDEAIVISYHDIWDGGNFDNFSLNFGMFEDNSCATTGYSEGLFYHERAYFDLNGQKIFEIDEYSTNRIFGGKFKSGYAPLFIEGADGRTYVTMIDKTGKKQFDPIVVDDAWMELDNGNLLVKINGSYKLLDCKGDFVKSVSASSNFIIDSYANNVLILKEDSTGLNYMMINMINGTKIGSY